jgi:hypothetical protein
MLVAGVVVNVYVSVWALEIPLGALMEEGETLPLMDRVLTVMLKTLSLQSPTVHNAFVLHTCTSKLEYVPDCEGVPETRPLELNVSPEGGPLSETYVKVAGPVAAIW